MMGMTADINISSAWVRPYIHWRHEIQNVLYERVLLIQSTSYNDIVAMLVFADAKCYTTTHQQLLRDRSRIHVICCRIQFGDSSILMATRAFCVVPGHHQIGESLWTSVTLPELKRSQLGMKVQHS